MSAATLQIAGQTPGIGKPIKSLLPELDELEQAVAAYEVQTSTDRERILVFDPDGNLDGVVRASAAGLACEVTVVTSMADLAEVPVAPPPTMAVLGGEITRAAALLRARPGCRFLPFAAVAGAASLDEAAVAVQSGATLCLHAPVEVEIVRGAIETLRRARRPERPRVLVIDDDAAAEQLAAMLVEIDMSASSLGDARGLLGRLEVFEPDALLLEAELPGLNGLSVCRALRAMPRWRGLPIVLLSGFVDEDSRLKAIEAGADDILQWPITRHELSSLLRARIDRSRQLLERSDRDPLTGLLNRRAFLEALQGRIADCSRHRRPLTLGLLDLDHFKLVNDRHGHLAGDRVLAAIGRHLSQRLRLEDLRGRWGGEELVIALPGEDLASAHRVIDRLRDEFSRLGFDAEMGAQFAATFSAGLAALPPDGSTVERLVRVADERLYRAKRAGRNCVISTD